MNKAVFFDRDGTINIESGYIRDLNNVKLIPGAAQAIKRLKEAGFLAILITNQSGPARGYYSEDWVNQLNQKVQNLLVEQGTCLDEIYYCPHLPDGTVPEYTKVCDCRKPAIGLIQKAQTKFEIDLQNSFMLGDKATDVELGQNAGCHPILLKTGYGERVLSGNYQYIPDQSIPYHIADNISDAAQWILNNH